jgi:hypothetical protein
MSQYTRTGSNLLSKQQSNTSNNGFIVGRVTDIDYKTGIISYESYSPTENVSKIEDNTNSIKAKPLNPSDKYYPYKGELVLIVQAPSPKSVTEDTSLSNYYISIVNIWNNTNNNAQFNEQDILFEQFNIPLTELFPGDKVVNGRFGNQIRFSNTNTEQNNFWKDGKNGEPIIVLGNVSGSLEDIEKDNLIILSSNQKLPLKTFTSTSNKITQTILPKNSSFKSQFLNAERIVLNTLKDDILLYSYKNTEIYSQDDITLNSKRILIDADKICLGQNGPNEPTEPALLGNKTKDLIRDLLKSLSSFSNKLSSAISTPVGTPLVTIVAAASVLTGDLQKAVSKLEKIKSKTVYLK